MYIFLRQHGGGLVYIYVLLRPLLLCESTYVGDDVGVQGIALSSAGNEGGIRGEEGALGRLAVELGAAELEVHGGRAGAKVGTGQGRGRGGGVGRARDADHGPRGEGDQSGEDDGGGKHFVNDLCFCIWFSERTGSF